MPVDSGAFESLGQHVAEPTIQCPHCQAEIKLTESLAAPLLRSREQEFKRLQSAQGAAMPVRSVSGRPDNPAGEALHLLELRAELE